jgi:hypothetical protein
MLSRKHGVVMSDEGTLRRLGYLHAVRERVAEAIHRTEKGIKEIEDIGVDLARESESLGDSHKRMLEKLDAQIAHVRSKISDA